jgi:hypothetical protein
MSSSVTSRLNQYQPTNHACLSGLLNPVVGARAAPSTIPSFTTRYDPPRANRRQALKRIFADFSSLASAVLIRHRPGILLDGSNRLQVRRLLRWLSLFLYFIVTGFGPPGIRKLPGFICRRPLLRLNGLA